MSLYIKIKSSIGDRKTGSLFRPSPTCPREWYISRTRIAPWYSYSTGLTYDFYNYRFIKLKER